MCFLDFIYFKKEEFVTPNAGESDDEFISRCIPVLIGEGKEEDQAAAICYSYLEMGKEDFEIDTSGLTPYVDPGVPKKKIGDILTPAQIETILEMASVLGVHEDDVEYVSAFQFAVSTRAVHHNHRY